MKKRSLAALLFLAPALAQAWPWSQDMANQVSVKPQESVNPANPGMTNFPKRSIPVPGTMTIVKDLDNAVKLKNPVSADSHSVEAGGKLFAIYCTPCHGNEGLGNGLVGAKFAFPPANLTAQTTRDRTDGFIWGYMTFGGSLMPTYANDLNPTERWHVVNYVRNVLQKAQSAAPAIK